MDTTSMRCLLHALDGQMNTVHLRCNTLLRFFALAISLLTPIQAVALDPWIPTAQELNVLPPYCRTKFEGQGSTDEKVWGQTLGRDYGHIHHYCAGLNFLNRYYRDSSNASYKLGKVVGEMGYMIDKSLPTFSLLPDIYLTRGKALILLKRHPEGRADILKALELNPRTLRAYLALTEFYGKLEDTGKALYYASEGLRHLPNSKALMRIYGELGGKQPYPEPYERQEKPIPQASEGSKRTDEESPAVTPSPPAETPSAPDVEQTPTAPAEKPVDSSSSPLGSPTNPWCRFCPN